MGNTSVKQDGKKVEPPVKEFAEVPAQIVSQVKEFKKKLHFKGSLKEHTKSLSKKDLHKEVIRAGEISQCEWAPKPTCIDYSIFDSQSIVEESTRQTVLDFKASSAALVYPALDFAIGCMYGMAIGDSWGHTLEFTPAQYERTIIKALTEECFRAPGTLNKFGLKPGQYTDDTSMGLCLADTLLVKGHVDCLDLKKRFVMWWYLGYNNAFKNDLMKRESMHHGGRSVGLGGQISYSLKQFLHEPIHEYVLGDVTANGNGSIMRLAPLPIFYHSSDTMLMALEAANQSFTTHSGLQSAECSILLSYIIVEAMKFKVDSGSMTGKQFLDAIDFAPILQYIHTSVVRSIAMSCQNEKWSPDVFNAVSEDQDWNWKDPSHRYSPTRTAINPGYVGGYCSDNLCMALHCVYHTSSFEEAVLRCINRAGDADTVGSVTGQIAGALYGVSNIPSEALKCVLKWDNAEIGYRAIHLYLAKENC